MFMGIEVTQSNEGNVLSQSKYALDLLEDTWMTDYRTIKIALWILIKN